MVTKLVQLGKKMIAGATVALGLGFAVSAAHATTVDYGSVLQTNLTTIEDIWATVATIVVGVALVTVGVRFFRKAK